jgi:4-hydroxy-2-oxoheptanedioate aldolase
MRTNIVKRRLRENQPSVGTWLALPDPFAALYMSRVGFDWLTVEMEHSPTDLGRAALMFQMIAQSGCVPLVRIPHSSAENVKRVLDCGAWGIVFPMQNSRAEVEDAVSWATYPPHGTRGVGGSLQAMSFDTDSSTYQDHARDEILIVVQIEHIKAVEAADEILSVPGIDAAFIGPADLSASMGVKPAGEVQDPRVLEAIDHVRDRAMTHGVAPGIHVFSSETARRRISEGFRFVALGTDVRFMTGAARAALESVTGT